MSVTRPQERSFDRVGSTVSTTQSITIQDLAVGASREYSAEFTMQNPSVTSRPAADILDHDYGW